MDPLKKNGEKVPLQADLTSKKMPEPVATERPPIQEKPERPAEIKPEKRPDLIDRDEHDVQKELESAVKEMPPISAPPTTKGKVRVAIEEVLQEDLKDVYAKMPADKKKIFRQKGEETASKIEILVKKTKINAAKILDLIKRWLGVIPGVNKFFLEQEAKIKADKILQLKDDLRKRGEL